MKANFMFKDGRMVMVPVQGDTWPETIDYKQPEIQGNRAKLGGDVFVTTLITRFFYVGAQYGVGAYVEQTP